MTEKLIENRGAASQAFLSRGVQQLGQAIRFVHQLPYGRNPDKEDLTTVFTDGCATCSTKHAILKQLALENNWTDIKLYIGIFRMHAGNTKRVGPVLHRNELPYLPEAHCYLKINGDIWDLTHAYMPIQHMVDELEDEIEILPHQITGFKVSYHRSVLKQWLVSRPDIEYNLEQIWQIREACIRALSQR